MSGVPRSSTGIPGGEDLLRSVIRDVLGDLLGDATGGVSTSHDRPTLGGRAVARDDRRVEATRGNVAVATQADLDALVRRVLADAGDPARRAAWERGQLRATLRRPGGSPPATLGNSPRRGLEDRRDVERGRAGGELRIERGAVTERVVQQAARDGAELVLGPRAVLTPLAKERARRAGVPIRHEDTSHNGGPGSPGFRR